MRMRPLTTTFLPSNVFVWSCFIVFQANKILSYFSDKLELYLYHGKLYYRYRRLTNQPCIEPRVKWTALRVYLETGGSRNMSTHNVLGSSSRFLSINCFYHFSIQGIIQEVPRTIVTYPWPAKLSGQLFFIFVLLFT